MSGWCKAGVVSPSGKIQTAALSTSLSNFFSLPCLSHALEIICDDTAHHLIPSGN